MGALLRMFETSLKGSHSVVGFRGYGFLEQSGGQNLGGSPAAL